MRNILVLLILIPIIGSAQFKGRKLDVTSFKAIPLNIKLEPDYELFNFRIDIIRETKSVEDTDSTEKTVSEEYSELGFNLGNALFCDLNGNISLRIDQILDIDDRSDFSLLVENYPFRAKHKNFYRYKDRIFSTKRKSRHNYRNLFSLDLSDYSIDKLYKNRYWYTIVRNEEGLFKKRKKRTLKAIYNTDINHYKTSKRKYLGTQYYMENDMIHLNLPVVVSMNENQKAIELRYGSKRRKTKPYRTILMNDSEIIIFDRNNRGTYIHYSNEMIEIFNYRRIEKRYRLITE